MQLVTMKEPTQDKPDYQCKKYQQRTRHRDSPIQKADFDHSEILHHEYQREA